MKITEDLIKKGSCNRPGSKNSCLYITVHDTANKKKGANASAHAKYIKTIKDCTSWHYTVDDTEVYRHIPDEEKSYHTSDKFANENSISLELCVNADGDFEKTLENAASLVRSLREKHNICVENIRRHYDWTGKACPESLMGKESWESFLKLCRDEEKSITVDELKKMGYTRIII